MSHLVNLFLLVSGAALIGFGFGLWAFHSNTIYLVLTVVVGLSLLVVAILYDKRHLQQLKEKRLVDISQRISELTKKPWLSDQTLQVHRSATMTLLAISMGIVSAILIKVGLTIPSISWTYLLGGLVFLAITVISLSRFYVGIGKPACEFNRNGFTTPIHGFISWKDVAGINFREITTRNGTRYGLLFRVENYAKIVTNIHWTDRMFGLFGIGAMSRGVIGVELNDQKEQPEMVYAVAKFLWKQATGYDYDWNPNLSDAYNESAKQLGKLITTQSTDPEILHDRLIKNPQAVLSEFEKVNAHQTIVTNELNKAARKLRIQLWIVSAGVLIFFLVRLYLLWVKHN
jgi:hypothetical protein